MWALSVSFMTGTDSLDLGHGEQGVNLSSTVLRDSCLEAYPVHFGIYHLRLFLQCLYHTLTGNGREPVLPCVTRWTGWSEAVS